MESGKYKVEYLITVDQNDAFCRTTEAFKNLITSIDGISLTKNELKFEDLSLTYEIQIGEISKDELRYFHLKLVCINEDKLNHFELLLKSIRSLLHKASKKPPQILWDGVSFNYAQMAYPLVHEIENTMRKLITKFMLINVGLGWTRDSIPKEVSESLRSKEAKLEHNYLYEVDFIQLSNFLFKEYSSLSSVALIEQLRNAKDIADLNLKELKLAIPKSNWDRYFSSLVKCESEYLKLRWEKLYDRRNQIAHNRPISRLDYESVELLYNELNPKLQQAIEHLDQVVISEDDKEVVSENAAVSKSAGISEFLNAWNAFHRNLFLLALTTKNNLDEKKLSLIKNNIRTLIFMIENAGLITIEQRENMMELLQIRNILVHHPDIVIHENELPMYIESIIEHIIELKLLIEQKTK